MEVMRLINSYTNMTKTYEVYCLSCFDYYEIKLEPRGYHTIIPCPKCHSMKIAYRVLKAEWE